MMCSPIKFHDIHGNCKQYKIMTRVWMFVLKLKKVRLIVSRIFIHFEITSVYVSFDAHCA